ncbi:unnamed protein product [Arctia plantaginis]|uniref:Uncharacterized protein n=1 Tax=Arctia plantaginis TaxID=874455 RepID=A0A8S1A855_ARCPL|nr:unnamed protein product [Arctia plantaginis]
MGVLTQEGVIYPPLTARAFKLQCTNTIQDEYAQMMPDAYSRAEILKQMVRDEIRQEQEAFLQEMGVPEIKDQSAELNFNYIVTEVNKNDRITPIMHDEPKIEKTKLEHTVSTSTTIKATSRKNVEEFNLKPLRTNIKKKKKNLLRARKPAEIFYRRELDHSLNYPIHEVHCLDLLSPYLMGEKGNGTFKVIKSTDRTVLRVLQLISEDTSTITKDEIYSILYQISTINIRLYQWDDRAMRLLFNQIIQAKVQTFKTLKIGIKRLLEKWHMDYGNIRNLLRQSRIFRPPCIQTSELTGSTRTSSGTRYPKLTTPKKICPPSEDDCD